MLSMLLGPLLAAAPPATAQRVLAPSAKDAEISFTLDATLHNVHGKVLETSRFPRAVFRPQQIQGSLKQGGTSEVVLKGTLLFHGAEHPVEIPAKVTLAGDHLTADG